MGKTPASRLSRLTCFQKIGPLEILRLDLGWDRQVPRGAACSTPAIGAEQEAAARVLQKRLLIEPGGSLAIAAHHVLPPEQIVAAAQRDAVNLPGRNPQAPAGKNEQNMAAVG